MTSGRTSILARSALALALVLGWAATDAPPMLAADEAGALAAPPDLAPWTGEVSLYRAGVFTTQQTWTWCTAASVQIARNIVAGEADHGAAAQRRYFEWMRGRNRYELPRSAGVDPGGWSAGMRRFVDDRYRLVTHATFDAALRDAATRIRLTGLPVALAVSHGSHAWLLTGFAATADPARTPGFRVTSVRVVGPLYGRQSRNGYDMKPNTRLTTAQLRGFFTPWRYAPMRMTWDGSYVSIQPVPAKVAAVADPPAPVIAPAVLRARRPPAAPAPASIATTPDVAAPGPIAAPEGPARGAGATAPAGPPAPPAAGLDGPPEPDPTAVPPAIVVAIAVFAALSVVALAGGFARRRARPGTSRPGQADAGSGSA